MISILIPTRKRPFSVDRLLNSIIDTADNLYDIEICFFIDDDDDSSISLIQSWSDKINIKILRERRYDKNDVNYKMVNELYKICSGEIIMYCGDDIVFKTKSWDSIVKNEFDKIDDKILLIYGRDGIQNERIATVGFLHRNWISVVGYLFPEYFCTEYNDTWITQVAKLAGRKKYIENLEFKHMHTITDQDETYLFKSNFENQDDLFIKLLNKRKEDADKLMKFIENKKIKNQKASKLIGRPLISLVSIVKNEEEILERMINSVKDIVDEFVIVDTGSTDKTKEIISKYQKVIEIPFVNYVETKNAALKKATGEYILFMDADEVLYQGAEYLKEFTQQNEFDSLQCKITEGDRNYNDVILQYNRIRIWKNNGKWKFIGPGVHEVISGTGKIMFDDKIKIRHDHFDKNPNNTNASKFLQWKELLLKYLEENPTDSRALFYLARTHKDLYETLLAIDTYKEYLDIPNNSYIDERWQAAYDCAELYKGLGDFEKTFEYCDLAESIDSRRCEHMNLRAEIFYLQHDYENATKFYEISSARPIPDNVLLFLNPFEYILSKEQLALSYYWNKKYDKSEKVYLELLKDAPFDRRLLGNIAWCRKKTNMNIFMTLGVTPEPIWGGVLNTQGVGGVETSYVELADKLSKLGHTVFLFCTTSEKHIYNNVKYIPFTEYSNYITFNPDVIITSRWLESFDLIPTAKKILWLQDASPMGRIYDFENIDAVIVSSEWHKDYLTIIQEGRIPAGKLDVISLGVDKSLFKKNILRDKNKVLYSSNPDRGLEVLSDMWGEITERVPQIKLSILYGWEGLKTWGTDEAWKKSVQKQQDTILEKFKPYENVTFVGRLAKDRLAEEMLSSSLLIYPNTIAETFCLTALEAQMAGMVIITSDFGALHNVVNDYGNIKIEGSPISKKYRETFISSIENMIRNDAQFELRSSYNKNKTASNLNGWNDIAELWQKNIWRIL